MLWWTSTQKAIRKMGSGLLWLIITKNAQNVLKASKEASMPIP